MHMRWVGAHQLPHVGSRQRGQQLPPVLLGDGIVRAIAAREHQVLPVRLARSAKLLHRRVCNSSGAPRTVRLLQPPRSVAAYKDLEAHHSSPATFPAAPRACRNASTRCAAHAFRSPLAQRMLNVFTSLWQHWGTQLSAIISWHGQLTETPITSIRKDSVARMP